MKRGERGIQRTPPWALAESVLAFAHHGLGDAVFMLPALKVLRSALPTARLIVTVPSTSIGRLIVEETGINEAIPYGSVITGNRVLLRDKANPQDRALDLVKFVLQLRRLSINLVVGSYVMRPRLLQGLKHAIGAKWLVGLVRDGAVPRGFDRAVRVTGARHAVEENLAILRAAAIPFSSEIPLHPTITRFGVNEEAARHNDNRYAVFHVTAAAGRDFKTWPLSYFQEIGAWLRSEYGMSVVLVGSQQEAEQLQRVASEWGASVAAGELRSTVELLRASEVFIGNDSGWLHVATALGVPAIGIYGPTDPGHHGPYGDMGKALSGHFPCSPCHEYLPKGCGLPACMGAVSPGHVIKGVRELLLRRHGG